MTDQTTGAAVSDYDTIGGGPAVSAVVNDFYVRVLGPQLAPYFEEVDMARRNATRCSWCRRSSAAPIATRVAPSPRPMTVSGSTMTTSPPSPAI